MKAVTVTAKQLLHLRTVNEVLMVLRRHVPFRSVSIIDNSVAMNVTMCDRWKEYLPHTRVPNNPCGALPTSERPLTQTNIAHGETSTAAEVPRPVGTRFGRACGMRKTEGSCDQKHEVGRGCRCLTPEGGIVAVKHDNVRNPVDCLGRPTIDDCVLG